MEAVLGPGSPILNMAARILLFLQEYVRNPVLDIIMKVYTTLGNKAALAIAMVLVLLCFKKTREVGFLMAVSLVLEVLLNNGLLKNLVARVRPYELIDGLKLIVGEADDWSFPSGHTGAFFAVAGVAAFLLPRKWGILGIVLAVLMGFSRLYVGIHYPSDVIAAALLGMLTSVLTVKVLFREGKLPPRMRKFAEKLPGV